MLNNETIQSNKKDTFYIIPLYGKQQHFRHIVLFCLNAGHISSLDINKKFPDSGINISVVLC